MLVALLLAILAEATASAQEYPSRPVTLIVPFPRGGATDSIGRLIATGLSLQLVREVSVENRPGSFGIAGMEAVAKSPADGYVIGIGSAVPMATAPGLYPSLMYDPVKSFASVGLIGKAPYLIVVNPSVAASSLRELIDLAKAKPGHFVYGSSGNGSTSHIAGEMFRMNADVNMVHAPYRGISPALNDLLAGRIHIMFEQSAPAPFLDNIRRGRLRAVAVAATHRISSLPDVPTAAEAGLPDYVVGNWLGLFTPAGTPTQILRRLNEELSITLKSNYLRKTLLSEGIEPMAGSVEEFSSFIASEVEKMSRAIKLSGIKRD